MNGDIFYCKKISQYYNKDSIHFSNNIIMILDSLSNSASIEQLHPLFKQAFDYLKSTDFSKKEAGKIVLDGDNLYISVAEPTGKSKDAAKLETHNHYIDIQMPLTTTETIGWKAGKNLKKISQPYNEKNDITFFEDEATTFIKVSPGEFAIFSPEDGHAPGIAEGKFRKVIVKVRI